MSMKRRKTERKKRRAPPSPPGEEDLNAMSRAVFGLVEERQPQAQAPGNDSIEDPLQDWPESPGEADQGLTERRDRTDEQRES